jgi:hypothetical protein
VNIDSQIQTGRAYRDNWSVDQIKNEPMFFGAQVGWALEHAGPITKAFLDAFIRDNEAYYGIGNIHEDFILDSRVHMLMKGWYPCIPGYHHDDVPRSGRDGQPNYHNPEYRSKHCMGLVNGAVCPTQFAIGESDFTIPETGIIYKQWHNDVVDKISSGDLRTVSAPSGVLLYFDDRSWHQGTPAVQDGWRWFGRISWGTFRGSRNEIRKQVQVYLEHPMEGW